MTKSITDIRNEISNFYLSSQDEVTDVRTGSVAGGLIYAVSAGIKELYDQLDEIERQSYVSTASGKYLDLLIEGNFDLQRKGATRSTGYVLLYADDPIVNPDQVGSNLICADYDSSQGNFVSGLGSSTKFSGENNFGSSSVVYSLIKPRNSNYFRRDRLNRFVIDLQGKQAKYLVLPVASVLTGRQVNLKEGSLSEFINPPPGLQYVVNVPNLSEYILNFGEASTSPIYSRNTSMVSYNKGSKVFSVVNAFNFSRRGFIDISYQSNFPTRLIRASYKSISGDEVTGGLSFEYSDKTQTSISLKSAQSYVSKYRENELITYNLEKFSYFNQDISETVTYYVDSSDVWRASTEVTLSDGITSIGPSTPVGPTFNLSGSTNFFQAFFGNDDWVIQQQQEQISEDVVFDPDNVLTSGFTIKEEYRLSTAQDSMNDDQYRTYFKNYIQSLPRATSNSLEYGALQVPGISFARVLPQENAPVGSSVLLASAENGYLSEGQRQNIIEYLKDDWVGAGINLVVSPPDVLGIKVSVSISLTDENLVNSVKRNIESSISNYLIGKGPGDEVKYGDIYSIISRIYGVKNVSKLIVGRNNPIHYQNYPHNYSKLVLDKVTEFNDDYFYSEDSAFFEPKNEVIFSSDELNPFVSPLGYKDFENVLTSKNLFGFNNNTLYGALQGVFSSDGNFDVISSSDYSININNDLFPISSDAVLKMSVVADSTDTDLRIFYSGDEYYDLSVTNNKLIRTFEIPLTENSTDVSVSFTSSDDITINSVQSFIHGNSIDSYIVSPYQDLKTLNFIIPERMKYVYDVEIVSNRYKTLKFINVSGETERARLESLLASLSDAACTTETASSLGVCSLSIFQTIIRDYQYGTNFSGENPQGYKNLFVSIEEDNDDAFKHFLNYVTTAPLSVDLFEFYPVSPDEAKNKEVSDYALSSSEISRIYQNIFNPNRGLSSSVSVEVI